MNGHYLRRGFDNSLLLNTIAFIGATGQLSSCERGRLDDVITADINIRLSTQHWHSGALSSAPAAAASFLLSASEICNLCCVLPNMHGHSATLNLQYNQ